MFYNAYIRPQTRDPLFSSSLNNTLKRKKKKMKRPTSRPPPLSLSGARKGSSERTRHFMVTSPGNITQMSHRSTRRCGSPSRSTACEGPTRNAACWNSPTRDIAPSVSPYSRSLDFFFYLYSLFLSLSFFLFGSSHFIFFIPIVSFSFLFTVFFVSFRCELIVKCMNE